MNKILFFLLFSYAPLIADPWGKDSDLTHFNQKTSAEKKFYTSSPFNYIAEGLIGLHQGVISHCDGPRSHFIPSSSQYTLEAVRKYGFCTGLALGCDRLMRENKEDWVYLKIRSGKGRVLKYNPVP